MDARPRERLGDRVERAIEDHVDVEGEIERGEAAAEAGGRSLRSTLVWLVVMGVSLYLVAPSVLEVLGSWEDLDRFAWWSLAAMAGLQVGALACMWVLQHIALRARGWYGVITSQLAGNGLSKIAPGGGAVGAALQYRMLVQAGERPGRIVAGLTAVNVLTFAAVLALPVLALPAILRGRVRGDLLSVAFLGLGVFAALFVVAALCLALDGPLAFVGRTVQRARNRLRRGSEPVRRLPERLLHERDRILAAFGPRWKRALLATSGRWAFDYLSLVAALAAVGAEPRPSLSLLAFCAAQVLAQIPLTPGGLGFVEAGLTAMLTLAGVSPGEAVLATFAYRLFSYWMALPLGVLGAALHRRRFASAAG